MTENPKAWAIALVAVAAALPVAIIQPAVVAAPALQAILVVANAAVAAVAVFLNIRQPSAE